MWNSLEVVSILVGVLTPVALALLGIAVTRNGRRAEVAAARAARDLEANQWANRRAVERLIELHKEMAPLLNDLLCFFLLIGHFRAIDPPHAIDRKRQLDRIFYVNEHLFDDDFRGKYLAFMSVCFALWESAGQDAKIKASAARLRGERGPSVSWESHWDQLFAEVPASQQQFQAQRRAYDAVMSAFAAQLGLGPRSEPESAGP